MNNIIYVLLASFLDLFSSLVLLKYLSPQKYEEKREIIYTEREQNISFLSDHFTNVPIQILSITPSVSEYLGSFTYVQLTKERTIVILLMHFQGYK
ncbi:hypothetical protein ACJX0J_036609, partial [Zea mays]